eukprot:gene8753-biopygen6112
MWTSEGQSTKKSTRRFSFWWSSTSCTAGFSHSSSGIASLLMVMPEVSISGMGYHANVNSDSFPGSMQHGTR